MQALRPLQGILEDYEFLVNLLFAGARYQWPSRTEREAWKSKVCSFHGGDVLSDWFDLCLRRALVERVEERPCPERAPKQEASGGLSDRFAFVTCTPLPRNVTLVDVDALWKPNCSKRALVKAYRVLSH